jgi:hypothetical protein
MRGDEGRLRTHGLNGGLIDCGMPQPRKPLLIVFAVLAIAFAGVLLGLVYVDWRARQIAQLTTAALRATSEVLPSEERAPSPHYRIVQVPARSREECLRERGGLADEAYLRCVQGYSYRQYLP